jgi:hypothetical protein
MKSEVATRAFLFILATTASAFAIMLMGWAARMVWFFLVLGWRLANLMAPL